jgi:hypothetical protein
VTSPGLPQLALDAADEPLAVGVDLDQRVMAVGAVFHSIAAIGAARIAIYGGTSLLSTNKAKEMKRRASQRRATHKARLLALTLRAETRMAAASEAEKGKTKVGSKGPVKSTVKASKRKKR